MVDAIAMWVLKFILLEIILTSKTSSTLLPGVLVLIFSASVETLFGDIDRVWIGLFIGIGAAWLAFAAVAAWRSRPRWLSWIVPEDSGDAASYLQILRESPTQCVVVTGYQWIRSTMEGEDPYLEVSVGLTNVSPFAIRVCTPQQGRVRFFDQLYTPFDSAVSIRQDHDPIPPLGGSWVRFRCALSREFAKQLLERAEQRGLFFFNLEDFRLSFVTEDPRLSGRHIPLPLYNGIRFCRDQTGHWYPTC